jgi:hypothetical protein
MADLKLAPEGLVIPPQYLSRPRARPERTPHQGGLIIESRDQAMARAQLRDLVARLRAAVGTEAPDDDEIAALVDEVRAERACHR